MGEIFILGDCSFSNQKLLENTECQNIRNDRTQDGGRQYCNCTYEAFQKLYFSSNLKLTSFLEKLRAWNCPQFKDECQNRYFDFNRFTFLVYEKFCNSSNVAKICDKEMKNFFEDDDNVTTPRLGMYRLTTINNFNFCWHFPFIAPPSIENNRK